MANPTITNNDLRPIVVGEYPVGEIVTVAQDAGGAIPAGAVLGEITMQTTAASVTVSAISGTGNGTCVKDATTPVLAGAMPGAYRIECVGDGADHNSMWQVRNPKGQIIGAFEINTIGGSFEFSNQIKFVLTDGSTDFASGAFFTFTVAAAASAKVKRSDSTAVDGSQYPKYVTSQEIDATAGDRAGVQLVKIGKVRKDALVFTGSEAFTTVVPSTGKTFGQLLEESGIIAIDGNTIGRYDNQ